MKNILISSIVVAAAAMSTTAAASDSANTIYAGVGTTGLTAGYARTVSADAGARLELNLLNYSGTFESTDASYDAKVKMKTGSAFVDYFPFDGSSFRITTGATFGERQIDLTGTSKGGTITINGTEYDSTGESVSGTIKWPSSAPYLGIGVGHKTTSPGFNFVADLGVSYSKPEVTMTASPNLLAAAGQSNVDAERDRVQEEADKFKLYPVIKFGIGYAF